MPKFITLIESASYRAAFCVILVLAELAELRIDWTDGRRSDRRMWHWQNIHRASMHSVVQ